MLDDKCSKLSNEEILHLIFPGNDYTVTIIWMISTYVHIVHKEIFGNKKKLQINQLIAVMIVRYLKHMAGRRTRLKQIEFTAAQDIKVP